MNIFQNVTAAFATWTEALQKLLQTCPQLQQGFDALSVTLPLAALLAFAGLGFMSAAARGLSVRRKRSSYEKCARQLALLALLLGWLLLIGSRIWLFFSQESYTPNSLPDFMVEMSWILLGLAVLFSSLYFALWKLLTSLPVVHVVMGMVSGIQGSLALLAALAASRLLAAQALPEATTLTLAAIYFPGWLAPFWRSLYWTLPLMMAMAGGFGAVWLVVRRKYDDFGRDHYNAMLPWCAAWARNAWAVFWLLLLASSVLDIRQDWQNGVFTSVDALRESALLLLWLAPALLWTMVSRSAVPLRLKPALLAAVLVAMAFMVPYCASITSLAPPAAQNFPQ